MSSHPCLYFENSDAECLNPAKRTVRNGVPTLCWTHYKPPSRATQAHSTCRKSLKKVKAFAQKTDLYFMNEMKPGRRTYLFNQHVKECENPVCHPTSEEEITLLFDSIHLSGIGYDPCAGTGTFARLATSANPNVRKVYTRDIDETHPGLDFYGDSLASQVPPKVDFIIMSPPFKSADLWLAWGVAQGVDVFIMHVAGDSFSNSYDARKVFYAPFLNNNLMHMVEGLPLVPGRKKRRCSFIVLFKNEAMRNKCLKNGKFCKVFHNKY